MKKRKKPGPARTYDGGRVQVRLTKDHKGIVRQARGRLREAGRPHAVGDAVRYLILVGGGVPERLAIGWETEAVRAEVARNAAPAKRKIVPVDVPGLERGPDGLPTRLLL
jgi:hypothetical protein